MVQVARSVTALNSDLVYPMGTLGSDGKWHALKSDASGLLNVAVASTVPTDASVTVNNTSTQILAANPNRLSALIKATASVIVYLNQGTTATTSGYPLNPGDALTIRHQLAVNGIVSSGTGTVYVIEEAR